MPPQGPRVVMCAFAVMALAVGLVALRSGWSEEGVRRVVRLSAQLGVVLFSLAFAASSLRSVWRSPTTAWLLRNRRYVGLSFGSFHLLHLAALGALAVAFPDPFVADLNPVTMVGGGTAYAFLVAMMATSNDASVRWLGRPRWTLLHTVGGSVIWTIFAISYVPRAFTSAFYAPFALLLLSAMGLRIARRVRRRSGRLAVATAAGDGTGAAG